MRSRKFISLRLRFTYVKPVTCKDMVGKWPPHKSKQPTTACLTWSARLSVCRCDALDDSAHSELSSFVSTQQAIRALLATSVLAEQLVFRRKSSTEPSCDVSPSLWPARLIRDHLLSKGYVVSDIWPAYWGVLAVPL